MRRLRPSPVMPFSEIAAPRRSARVQAQPKVRDATVSDAALQAQSKQQRRRTKTASKPTTNSAVEVSDTTTATNGRISMPPPATPNKRRRLASDAPSTPTPSAIGLMTSMNVSQASRSSGDIDGDGALPLERPAAPHHTNVTLVTPRGTHIQPSSSNLRRSPSKPDTSTTSTKTILDEACAHLIRVDPGLQTVINKHRCAIFSPEGLAEVIDPFRSLSSSIMAQQVSGAAASSIKNKFVSLFSEQECRDGFPTPQAVASTPIPRLREAGLSQRKAEYVQGLAEKFTNRELTVDMLMRGSDEEVMNSLIAVRGLGRWSVEMFMCFGLKRLDVFSTGDLGVQRGMAAYVGRDVARLKAKGGKWKYMSEQEMLERSEPFRPYRSLFMWYMWRIEDVDVGAIQNN